MKVSFPFMTSYDPPGSSEGALDPLGLYQIAEQLAVQLVPAVRERMQRIRFLTAMAVGAVVTEVLEDDPRNRDASPYLVWEWLLVEAITRSSRNATENWGVPGTSVTSRALVQYGCLDARSYLKTPRIFGFHGVYKRLAAYLSIVDVHLGIGPQAEALADAWARDLGLGGLSGAKPLIARWSRAVQRSLSERPPRTNTGWSQDAWLELSLAFAPSASKTKEKRCLQDLLLSAKNRRLGALPTIWQLQAEFVDDEFCEERLHDRIETLAPDYGTLLGAIRAYEAFSRSLQDAFDLLRAEATRRDAQGYSVPQIAADFDFRQSVNAVHERFALAFRNLGELVIAGMSIQSLFADRFQRFGSAIDPAECAIALCEHHEGIQRAKSAMGKRPWFDRLGQDRISIRHDYRIARPKTQPGRYVHDYRGWPIRRFWKDLG
jgi:hypothetical protein